MTTDELEALLEGQGETQNLDFKACSPWDVTSFAKDILAFSNVQDGGTIIIGIEDGTLARQGTDERTRGGYKIDIMRDQMTAYADPHVVFSVDFPIDRQGLQYVCIRIEPFSEIPVLCRRDSADTQAGALYYRNRNRRMESAKVSNSYDMREIIENATVLMMRRMQRIGFGVDGSATVDATELEKTRDQEVLDAELGGL
jgi:predicted HTH transcriptional regulator